jgi:hypothetical protein
MKAGAGDRGLQIIGAIKMSSGFSLLSTIYDRSCFNRFHFLGQRGTLSP